MADRIVYTKFSNDRARQYCIKTDIIKRDENKVVRKEALIPESRSHILAMLQTEQKLGDMLSRSKMVPNHIVGSGEDYVEFEYIQGQAYDEILDDYVLCGDLVAQWIFTATGELTVRKCTGATFPKLHI